MKKILCLLLVLSMLLLCSCSKKTVDEVTTDVEETVNDSDNEIGYGVYAVEMSSFTGPYYEDGSNNLVSGVMGVLIENRSDEDYQEFNFNMTINGEVYEFDVSALLSGMKVFVLEKNQKPYAETGDVSAFEIIEVGKFIVKPNLHTDMFKIDTADGDIRVENIGNESVNNVYVYYKNISEDGIYLGGITYRVHIDYIRAGVVQQAINETFSQKSSKVVFVSYDEMY